MLFPIYSANPKGGKLKAFVILCALFGLNVKNRFFNKRVSSGLYGNDRTEKTDMRAALLSTSVLMDNFLDCFKYFSLSKHIF